MKFCKFKSVLLDQKIDFNVVNCTGPKDLNRMTRYVQTESSQLFTVFIFALPKVNFSSKSRQISTGKISFHSSWVISIPIVLRISSVNYLETEAGQPLTAFQITTWFGSMASCHWSFCDTEWESHFLSYKMADLMKMETRRKECERDICFPADFFFCENLVGCRTPLQFPVSIGYFKFYKIKT